MRRPFTLLVLLCIVLSAAPLSPTTPSSRADHFGCNYPAGTGDPAPGFDPPLAVREQFQKDYCSYKNGTNGKAQRDLGVPYGDPTTGRVHLWDGVWNQNFVNGNDYTNLMYQPADGRVYRNYGVWLDKLIARGGPGEMGAPSSDPRGLTGGVVQDRRGGRAGTTVFTRRRDGEPVYAVHGGWYDKYLALGGTSGFLGWPTSDERRGNRSSITGAQTLFLTFEGGALQYHVDGPRSGLMVEIHGAIRAYWEQLGAGASLLGLPISDEQRDVSSTGIEVHFNKFEFGSIEHHFTGPYAGTNVYLIGKTYEKYGQIGYARGRLGMPIQSEQDARSVTGVRSKFTKFEKGSIEYHVDGPRANQAFYLFGRIYEKWREAGFAGGSLGLPITDDTETSYGAKVDFERGTIVYCRSTDSATVLSSGQQPCVSYDGWNGPHMSSAGTKYSYRSIPGGDRIRIESGSRAGQEYNIVGAFHQKYAALGYGGGRLGVPVTNEGREPTASTGTNSNFQHFENAKLTYHIDGPRAGLVVATGGDILSKYGQLGGQGHFLGVPISDEGVATSSSGAEIRYSKFERGSIEHHFSGANRPKTVYVIGQTYNTYAGQGYAGGPLGAPIADEMDVTSKSGVRGKATRFENGSIEYHVDGPRANQAFYVRGQTYRKWQETGFAQGPLGLPIQNEFPTKSSKGTNGYATKFEFGSIEYHVDGPRANQAFFLFGRIYDKWRETGFANSGLGLPISSDTETPYGAKVDFEGGTIVYCKSADSANILQPGQQPCGAPPDVKPSTCISKVELYSAGGKFLGTNGELLPTDAGNKVTYDGNHLRVLATVPNTQQGDSVTFSYQSEGGSSRVVSRDPVISNMMYPRNRTENDTGLR